MDRLIHTALNSIHNLRNERTNQAQNLANMNVPGFRRDLSNDGHASFLEEYDGIKSRAFQLETGTAGFSDLSGVITQTGLKTDVAIVDKGYFYIQPENGEVALSRRGDLNRDSNGLLRDGAGELVLSSDLEPIELPQYRDMLITELGEIRVLPMNAADGEYLNIATIATLVPPPDLKLQKRPDGHIRASEGELPPPNQQAKIVQGALEGSNVNAVEEMIATMEAQRSFEINMKLISNAKDLDEAGTRIMQLPS